LSPFSSVQNDFGYFLLILKILIFLVFYRMLSMRPFFAACSAFVAHFLPHAQYAQHIFERKLSMHKYFDSFESYCVG
jgi:cell division protein FtsW (lipid II flippase)